MDAAQGAAALIRKLESITDLSAEEKDALTRLPMTIRQAAADETVVREGDRPSDAAWSWKALPAARRSRARVSARSMPSTFPTCKASICPS